jgi:hypothetical protein
MPNVDGGFLCVEVMFAVEGVKVGVGEEVRSKGLACTGPPQYYAHTQTSSGFTPNFKFRILAFSTNRCNQPMQTINILAGNRHGIADMLRLDPDLSDSGLHVLRPTEMMDGDVNKLVSLLPPLPPMNA